MSSLVDEEAGDDFWSVTGRRGKYNRDFSKGYGEFQIKVDSRLKLCAKRLTRATGLKRFPSVLCRRAAAQVNLAARNLFSTNF